VKKVYHRHLPVYTNLKTWLKTWLSEAKVSPAVVQQSSPYQSSDHSSRPAPTTKETTNITILACKNLRSMMVDENSLFNL